jgi:hypothetical protein
LRKPRSFFFLLVLPLLIISTMRIAWQRGRSALSRQ